MSDRDYLYGHVCVHGSMARFCRVCPREAEARELRGDRDELETSYYTLLSKCHGLEEKIKALQKDRAYLIKQRGKELKWAEYWRTEMNQYREERDQLRAEIKELHKEISMSEHEVHQMREVTFENQYLREELEAIANLEYPGVDIAQHARRVLDKNQQEPRRVTNDS